MGVGERLLFSFLAPHYWVPVLPVKVKTTTLFLMINPAIFQSQCIRVAHLKYWKCLIGCFPTFGLQQALHHCACQVLIFWTKREAAKWPLHDAHPPPKPLNFLKGQRVFHPPTSIHVAQLASTPLNLGSSAPTSADVCNSIPTATCIFDMLPVTQIVQFYLFNHVVSLSLMRIKTTFHKFIS